MKINVRKAKFAEKTAIIPIIYFLKKNNQIIDNIFYRISNTVPYGKHIVMYPTTATTPAIIVNTIYFLQEKYFLQKVNVILIPLQWSKH